MYLTKRQFHPGSRMICGSDFKLAMNTKFKKSRNMPFSKILSFYSFISLIYTYQTLLPSSTLNYSQKLRRNWNHHHKFSRNHGQACKDGPQSLKTKKAPTYTCSSAYEIIVHLKILFESCKSEFYFQYIRI